MGFFKPRSIISDPNTQKLLDDLTVKAKNSPDNALSRSTDLFRDIFLKFTREGELYQVALLDEKIAMFYEVCDKVFKDNDFVAAYGRGRPHYEALAHALASIHSQMSSRKPNIAAALYEITAAITSLLIRLHQDRGNVLPGLIEPRTDDGELDLPFSRPQNTL